mmetsp:Transcript_13437/g.25834  ORF Transcript_13437/g.25834 Transcript_13437/m.25834 type:complete len:347 (-) Transcript_13437:178-1218(-)
MFTSDPSSTKAPSTATCPQPAAQCIAVTPSASCRATSAPRDPNTFTVETWPLAAARPRAVSPKVPVALNSTPNCASSKTFSSSPTSAARSSAACLSQLSRDRCRLAAAPLPPLPAFLPLEPLELLLPECFFLGTAAPPSSRDTCSSASSTAFGETSSGSSHSSASRTFLRARLSCASTADLGPPCLATYRSKGLPKPCAQSGCFSLQSLPNDANLSMHSKLPDMAAVRMGVWLQALRWVKSAPSSISLVIASTCPAPAATCNAHTPSPLTARTSAPCRTNHSIASTLPPLAAQCRAGPACCEAVSPDAALPARGTAPKFTLAPASNSLSITSTSPAAAAQCRAVAP